MHININLSKDEVEMLLESCDYVTEDVSLYYYPYWDSYSHGSDKSSYEPNNMLRSIRRKVAYKRGEKPSSLMVEQPLDSENSQYLIDNVVVKLFKKKLLKLIL